jgi:signal transduction histidine kinase
MARTLEGTAAPLDALDPELVAPGLLHELRQPLMGADAAATLLERLAGGQLQRLEEWHLLRGQLARMAEIVNGYEELLQPGRVAPVAFAVAPVVARSIELLAHRVRPLGDRFAFVAGEASLVGWGRPSALVHAATNLLANAVDAVEARDETARVEVRVLTARAGGGVEIRFSDEGVGIPPSLRDRVFEPRFTTKPPGKGTGLGLHLARRLMALTGGEVYLVSSEDSVRLPWAITELGISMPAPPAPCRGGEE